jgi:hypothetical protein
VCGRDGGYGGGGYGYGYGYVPQQQWAPPPTGPSPMRAHWGETMGAGGGRLAAEPPNHWAGHIPTGPPWWDAYSRYSVPATPAPSLPQPPPPPQGMGARLSSLEEEDLANLLMSWYYAGYYTGKHAAARDAGATAAPSAPQEPKRS